MANAKKQTQLSALEEVLKQTPNFALFHYEKVPHITLEALRKELRASNSKIQMIKNTLFQKALRRLATKDKKLSEMDKTISPIKGNSALLSLGEDWSAGLSVFHKFSKDKGLSFKAGYLENEVYMQDKLEHIATLPPKLELISMVIGSMKSPMTHLTYSMKFNIQKLAYVLKAKSDQTA